MAAVACAGCGKTPAPMQCPTCVKLGLPATYFCEQECFQKSWKAHKKKHKEAPEASISTMSPESMMMFAFTGKLRPAKITPMRTLPAAIPRPDYATHPEGHSLSEQRDQSQRPQRLKEPEEIEGLRKVCRLAREVLDIAAAAVKPGVTGDQIDKIVHDACIARESYPSPLNYYGFPKSVCVSANEVICHGIPDARPLEEGDIVNIDVTLYHGGYHGDLNETLFVGRPSPEAVNLVLTAYECLWSGINDVKPGTFYRNVANGIEKRAKEGGCSVVRTYCGHGIHRLFHTSPTVPHYTKNKATGVMEPGHAFTIEPMINAGIHRDKTWPDNWTSVTEDGKWSAQFEETMLVTADGVDILTMRPNPKPYFARQLDELGIKYELKVGPGGSDPRWNRPAAAAPAAPPAAADAPAPAPAPAAAADPPAAAEGAAAAPGS
eukprot:TRINITY_DN15623_c0_g2_i1.p2 TRINITY_DN15623_c0_g2~~TRINITY_DN15623_c0_g2_i1.p2  ORF type:complete len:454 (+),score=123.78 TRINITY_DN15623_c0_g2_i1:62-1363(+)